MDLGSQAEVFKKLDKKKFKKKSVFLMPLGGVLCSNQQM